jgi:uncharacterized protein
MYDTGTSKVLQCDDLEFIILDKLSRNELDEAVNVLVKEFGENRFLEALINIKTSIETENILKSENLGDFYLIDHFEDLENQINNNLNQITLELTEKCNLRCGYCIYNDNFTEKRNHGTKEMTEEVAKAAIQYIHKHGSKDEISITFYGGEPLIKLSLIKQCIEYSKEIIQDKSIHYSMTTNLLLMTPETANYIASMDNFYVVCSLDGPQHIHDDYRKDLNGDGSFDRAIKGLQYLINALGESAKDRILINMVYSPPYYLGKLDEINDYFNNLKWLPNEIEKLISYAASGSIPLEVAKKKYEEHGLKLSKNDYDFSLMDWSASNYINDIKNKGIASKYFTKKMVETQIAKIHNRSVFNEPNGQYPLNACCIPGARKLYVTTEGKFLLCERVCDPYPIGDIFSGVDIKKVKKTFVDDYSFRAKEKCTNCWAVRLCSLCYAQYHTEPDLNIEKRAKECKVAQKQVLESLQLYHECLEIDPDRFKYMDDISNSFK